MLQFSEKNPNTKNKASTVNFFSIITTKSKVLIIFLFWMHSNKITFRSNFYIKSNFKSKTSIFEYCRYSSFDKKFKNCFKIAFLCKCSDGQLFFKQLYQNYKISNFFLKNIDNQNNAQKIGAVLRISDIFLKFF